MSDIELDPEAVEWSKRMWESLNDGGEWTIPRSGAKFRKQGNQLVHVEGFTTEGQFDAIQTKMHFAAFGVEVVSILEGTTVAAFDSDSTPIPVDGRRRGT